MMVLTLIGGSELTGVRSANGKTKLFICFSPEKGMEFFLGSD